VPLRSAPQDAYPNCPLAMPLGGYQMQTPDTSAIMSCVECRSIIQQRELLVKHGTGSIVHISLHAKGLGFNSQTGYFLL